MYEYRKLTPEQRQQLVSDRQARGYPPHSPPHPIDEYTYYLLTASCYEHTHHLLAENRRQQLQDLLFEQFITNGLEIQAWVILPNHYHLLVSLSEIGVLSRLFQKIHGSTSFQWNLADQTRGRKIWYRFTDRAIRSERHYCTTLNYIHFNPVKHGWAKSPYEWKESSIHWYLAQFGREWLRDSWVTYPVRDYGVGWDDI